jgi:hypothetical protein
MNWMSRTIHAFVRGPVFALALCTGAVALVSAAPAFAAPAIDGNIDDMVTYANDLNTSGAGCGMYITDKPDGSGNPTPETIDNDLKSGPEPSGALQDAKEGPVPRGTETFSGLPGWRSARPSVHPANFPACRARDRDRIAGPHSGISRTIRGSMTSRHGRAGTS